MMKVKVGSLWHRSKHLSARSDTSRKDSERGFTLVEILVVITIIALIMSLVGPQVLNYLSESKVKAAKIQMQSFSSALDLLYLDTGRYPSSAEGLDTLVKRTSAMQGWNGPYLKGGSVPNDPWGKPYRLSVADRARQIRNRVIRRRWPGRRDWNGRRHIASINND